MLKQIRNFAIIAHVDHGKSTLADRFLERTGVVKAGSHDEQFLDRNPISRERGITIKLAPVQMKYLQPSPYILNLIDTPGHVDFSYEVDRTLACVEGVLLLVDATQGIQAQTVSNALKAKNQNIVIIPVINKIDLPNAQIAETKKELVDVLGVDEKDIIEVSAKTGLGVNEAIEKVIQCIPPPLERSDIHSPPRALIFDSYYDSHRGVIAFVRVFDGSLKKGDRAFLAQTTEEFIVNEVGIFTPDLLPCEKLSAGDIGYVITNLKHIRFVQVGDTILDPKRKGEIVPGYQKVKPMVFASLFPVDPHDYVRLTTALEKLTLNDSSLTYSSIYSTALGAGFRVGFLGLLHADVVRERLEREFDLDLVLTPPKVEFKKEGLVFHEPYVKLMILTPQEYVGAVMRTCTSYRGRFITMDNRSHVSLVYELPLSEMISDFFDTLKSVSSGYASMDWEFVRFEPVEADTLRLLLNGDEVEEFSEIVVKERAQERGEELTKKLRGLIPRQQYEVRVQAQYKGRIIASERIAPFRKDVLIKSGKVIGAGDVGRKRKLLEKQKEGKKKMKMIGRVEVPKEAFMSLFKK